MIDVQKEILHYIYLTISIFIGVQLWSSYDTYEKIQMMYLAIQEEAENSTHTNSILEKRMWLNESFKVSTKVRNEFAKPFLELISNTDKSRIRDLKSNFQFTLDNLARNNYETKLDRTEQKLISLVDKYPSLFNYTKASLYKGALLRVGTLYSNCCFCGPRYSPLIENRNGKYYVYPNYFSEQNPFSKYIINGKESNYGYSWTPDKPGQYTFDVEYVFINDLDQIESTCEEFTLTAVDL